MQQVILIPNKEDPLSSSLPEKWEKFWGSPLVSVPPQGTSLTWEVIVLLCPPFIPNPNCFLSVPKSLAEALGWDSRQA